VWAIFLSFGRTLVDEDFMFAWQSLFITGDDR
jgi:hypothetical protein